MWMRELPETEGCDDLCPCRSLVDTVYSLKDEVQELKQVSAGAGGAVPPRKLLRASHPHFPPGQQEDEEDAGGRAASEERAGKNHPEGPEKHERPNVGRDQPVTSSCTFDPPSSPACIHGK